MFKLKQPKKAFCLFIITYLVVLIGFMLKAPLSNDTYYYLQWSKHLALSYYDGSPLIAYVLYVITHLFGQSTIAIYSISFFALVISAASIYQLAYKLFNDASIAKLATVLWMLMPGVMHYFIFRTTYDTIMIVFWGLTLLCYYQLITEKQCHWYYLTGLCFGLLLLSKYTGILLGVSLLLYTLYDKNARVIFSSKHCYFALLLALAIVSPIIFWNYQHHWLSFRFQLHHGFTQGGHLSVFHTIKSYLIHTLIDYSFAFVIIVVYAFKNINDIRQKPQIMFVLFPTVIIWCFFLISSVFSSPNPDWNAPFIFTGTLFTAYFLSKKPVLQWMRYWILAIFALISLVVLVCNTFPELNPSTQPGRGEVDIMRQFASAIPSRYYETHPILVDTREENYWAPAMLSYFLPKNRGIYASSLQNGNQFYFWWQADKNKLPKTVLYLSNRNTFSNQQLTECRSLMKKSYAQKKAFQPNIVWNFYLSLCQRHLSRSVS